MSIKQLVSQCTTFIPPFSALSSVEEQLKRDRFIVVSEKDNYRGLVTLSDVLGHPHKLVIDCITEKPVVQIDCSITDVIEIMETGSFHAYLPLSD